MLTQTKMQNLWMKALFPCLCAYAMLGRGFSYFFVGEFMLVLGFCIFLLSGRLTLVMSDSVLALWGLFALWGAARTIPFLGGYGSDAIRDAVLWGYGIFALIIAAFINNSATVARALNAYRKFLRWYLLLLPILLFTTLALKQYLWAIPWATNNVPIIALRSGEAAVHLAGAGLFLAIFSEKKNKALSFNISLPSIVGFLGVSAACVAILINSRGGFLAMTVPYVLASTLKLRKFGWKIAAFAVIAAVLAIGVLETDMITFTIHGRAFSADQVGENLASIVGAGHAKTDTENTKTWRLMWWHKIITYTFFGNYFWTGKGFGKNLIVEDGPPNVSPDDLSTRSPHNASMTVLARMGVPGFVLWLLLNGLFATRMFAAYRRAVREGRAFWARVNLWIFCYWLAALINMSFDVYLEGPQGGIWFWTLIGFGLASLRVQAHEGKLAVASRQQPLMNSHPALVHAR